MSKAITVKESDILKVESGLTKDQIQKFFSSTPESKIRKRPAKGGGEWSYVSGSYVTQVLNSLFGFNWSFEVLTNMEEALKTVNSGTIVVQGRLKVKIGDEWITKEQYGRKEVTFKKGTTDLLDFGNDMKAAATDAKKKCASELGLFADVYSQEDFFEAEIVDYDEQDILEQLRSAKTIEDIQKVQDSLKPDDLKAFTTAIKNKLADIAKEQA